MGDDHQDRPEDLLPGDPRRVVEAGHQGRFHEESLVPIGWSPTAGGEGAAELGRKVYLGDLGDLLGWLLGADKGGFFGDGDRTQ